MFKIYCKQTQSQKLFSEKSNKKIEYKQLWHKYITRKIKYTHVLLIYGEIIRIRVNQIFLIFKGSSHPQIYILDDP